MSVMRHDPSLFSADQFVAEHNIITRSYEIWNTCGVFKGRERPNQYKPSLRKVVEIVMFMFDYH